MNRSVSLLFFCLTLGLAGPVLTCEEPTDKPEIPDPATAATAQMVKANNEVKAYVAAMTEYLNCARMSPSEQRKEVKKLEGFAEEFNQAIRDFKARQ